jgi:SEC-C motif
MISFFKRLFEKNKPVPNVGRNDECWCGSGLKYKRCHMSRDAQKKSKELAAACWSKS